VKEVALTAIPACSVTPLHTKRVGVLLGTSHYYMEVIRFESRLEYKID
jgi:hypothetical protein